MTLRTCGGGACERKNDCQRFRERREHPHGERYPVPPYRFVRTIDAEGRPLAQTHQICEEFEQWKAPNG